ncbi:MAG: DUF3253 domain-containing protein [Planctomycetota bacterium]
MIPSDDQIRDCILELCRARGPHKTICPSEVARNLDAEDWRALMGRVRDQAEMLVRAGLIEVTQKGRVIVITDAKGPIRLRFRSEP